MTRARLVWAATFLLLLVALGASALVYYQEPIARFVIKRFEQSSGLKLSALRARVRLGTHLIVVFEDASAADATGELFKSETAQLLVSYHALIWGDGLPLYAVVLDRPQLRLKLPSLAGIESVAALQAPAITALTSALSRLSDTVRKIRIFHAKLADPAGGAAVEDLDVLASRKRSGAGPWRIRFEGTCKPAPLPAFKMAGDFKFGVDGARPGRTIGHGELWAWSSAVKEVRLGDHLALTGLKAKIELALRNDGHLSGSGNLAAERLVVSAAMLKAPLSSTDYAADFTVALSPDRLELSSAGLRHQGRLLMAGQGYLTHFFAPGASFGLQVGGLEVDAQQLKWLTGLLRAPPPGLQAVRMEAGRISLDEVALAATRKELKSPWPALAGKVVLDARLSGVRLSAPAVPDLPPLDALEAKLNLARGTLSLTQASARLGNTVLSGTSASVKFSKSWQGGSYRVRTQAQVDLAELWQTARALLKSTRYEPDRYLSKLAGAASVSAAASGDFSSAARIMPADYAVQIQPLAAEIRLKELPRDFSLSAGVASLRPGSIGLDHVRVAAHRGVALLTGSLDFDHAKPAIRDLIVELKGVPVEDWSALAVNPDRMAINGPADGKVEVRHRGPGRDGYSYEGTINIGPGELKLGFLRAPIAMKAAVLRLDGKRVELHLPDARLEGSKLDFKLAVSDLRKPALRIDARLADLDLEAMKFIRMPWAPKRSVDFFGHTIVSGRVEAKRARLAKLHMTDLIGDFARDKQGWRVYNLSAATLAGKLDLDLSGRARDDWIGIKGHAAAIEVAQLLRLPEANSQMLDGRLFSDFDLWADSGPQFFNTLSGKCSIVIRDGTLKKFTILSRMLNLVDLRNWLTAQFHDPLLVGVPFSAVTGEFSGAQGGFYTDNLLLEGPLMDISAAGTLGVGQGTMDMQVSMFPFQTVNWLLDKIPILGDNISKNSADLLAAYFWVHGSMRKPSVRPAPITSLTELIKKTLGLPVNIIKPQTIR